MRIVFRAFARLFKKKEYEIFVDELFNDDYVTKNFSPEDIQDAKMEQKNSKAPYRGNGKIVDEDSMSIVELACYRLKK